MTAVRYEVRTVNDRDHVVITRVSSHIADKFAMKESARPSIQHASVYCNDVWLTSYVNGERDRGASD